MLNKRLLRLVPGATLSAILCAAFRWLALIARIHLLLGIVHALSGLFGGTAPQAPALIVAAAQATLFFGLRSLAGWSGTRAGSEAAAGMSREVFDKLVRLGPSFESRVEAGEASQLMGGVPSACAPTSPSTCPSSSTPSPLPSPCSSWSGP
jgi:ATP-binding cassette subfamily B protein